MSRDGYLPPGVEYSDIPGNTGDDAEWEKLIDEIADSGLTAADARRRWESQPKMVGALKFVSNMMRVTMDWHLELSHKGLKVIWERCFDALRIASGE